MSRRRPLFTLRASLRTALADAGDNGATLAELKAATGTPHAEVKSCLNKLGENAEKFSVYVTGKVWRHFATEAQRDAWVQASQPAKVALTADKLRSIRIHCDKVRGSKMAPPPLGARTVPTAKQNINYTAGPSKRARPISSDAVITASTRVTVAPTPLPRFHVPADHRGPFSLAGIGRDVTTGRGWA